MTMKTVNRFDSIFLDSHSSVSLPTGMMKSLEAAMDSIARTEEDPDLVQEIVAVKGARSRNNGTGSPPASQKIDPELIDSLIHGASLLLTDERPVEAGAQTSGFSLEKLATKYRKALKRIDRSIDALLNGKP